MLQKTGQDLGVQLPESLKLPVALFQYYGMYCRVLLWSYIADMLQIYRGTSYLALEDEMREQRRERSDLAKMIHQISLQIPVAWPNISIRPGTEIEMEIEIY